MELQRAVPRLLPQRGRQHRLRPEPHALRHADGGDSPRRRLPHHPRRQSTLGTYRHTGLEPLQHGIHGQHRRFGQRPPPELSARRTLRQPPQTRYLRLGAEHVAVLRLGNPSDRGADARSAENAGRPDPPQTTLLPLLRPLLQPHTHSARRTVHPKIPRRGNGRTAGPLRLDGRGNGQKPGRRTRLPRSQRDRRRHDHPLHVGQRRSLLGTGQGRRAPHAKPAAARG